MTDKERLEALELSGPKDIAIKAYLLKAIEETNHEGNYWLKDCDYTKDDNLLCFIECDNNLPDDDRDWTKEEIDNWDLKSSNNTLKFGEVIMFMQTYNLFP